ncbi:hypothetical protein FPV67DRAFT_1171459 [Lyophyllum atratum]|nr:hypothetical protein FPV67DRAFT_1171459 [Lyophyllum atratum]
MNAALLPQELLLIASTQLHAQALLIREQSIEYDDDDNFDGDEDDLDREIHETGVDAQLLQQLGNDALALSQVLGSSRGPRGPYDQIEKCTEYFTAALGWPDKEFRHEFRLGRQTFDRIVTLLERNSLFISRGRKPQRAVRYQLAAFLMRYGKEGSDTMSIAKRLGLGLGTVWIYCRRVTRALRELSLSVISWGDEDRLHETAEFIRDISGLGDCIGVLDGSLIRLDDIPTEWGPLYFCRKKFPALRLMYRLWLTIRSGLLHSTWAGPVL